MEYISSEQEKIVTDRSRIRKVSGCAGSRKTDTMIKCGIYFMTSSKKDVHCLFLTLVGSVTDEITERINNYLNISIEKQGISNHYMGRFQNHTIEIANYDAFIHKQLEQHDDPEIYSTDFDKKAEKLLDYVVKDKQPHFLLKDNKKATMILVDEFQDISSVRAQILMEYFKRTNTKTKLVVMGDILQTIFPQALTDKKHPLVMIDDLQPTTFRLNTCFRCPKSHLDVVNCITKNFRSQYNIPEMNHYFDIPSMKPLFFTHESISSHAGALETANTIFKMIQTLMEQDPLIKFKDIVIIMKRSNHQLVFTNLLMLFGKHKIKEHCLVSKTKTYFNEHQPINWKEGKDKLMMLSIHGDKGKGHPVVFFAGFSGGAIPEERHFHKMEELLSQSLLNVALTRSTKYLFIGMTRTYPSFYFFQAYHELKQLAYFSWKYDDIECPVIKAITAKLNHDAPVIHRCNIRKQMLMTPLKNIIFVHQDDKSKQIMKKPTIVKHKIGQSIKNSFGAEDRLIILHGIAKLVFLKKIKPRLLLSIFEPFMVMYTLTNVYYTDDENLLCQVKDSHLHRFVIKDPNYWFSTMNRLGYTEFKKPVFIIHSVFKDSLFLNVSKFTKEEEYTVMDVWNSCIFFLEYIESHVHNIRFYYNHPTDVVDDFEKIKVNIDEYIKFFKTELGVNGFKRFRFQQKSSLIGNLTIKEELEKIGFQSDLEADRRFFSDGYKFGISSTIDFLETKYRVMVDFKTYSKNECVEEWVYQDILNCLLSFTKVKHVHIFNVMKGVLYTFQITSKYELKKMLEPLLTLYEFHPMLIQKLENQLDNDSKSEIIS